MRAGTAVGDQLHNLSIPRRCWVTDVVLTTIMMLCGCRPGTAVDSGTPPRAALPEVTGDVARQVVSVAPEGRAIRLAIITFSPTQSQFAKKNDFGEFFTEELLGELKKSTGAIRLFERSRLEVITRENALTLSGLVNEEEAARIGQLAPIDYILTGTYTKLKNMVGVNTRMLDVVSGEIVFTSNLKVSLNENLSALFVEQKPSTTPTPAGATEKVDTCAEVKRTIDSLLLDLSTPARLNALAEAAVGIPFDMACGRVHFRVLGMLARHKMSHGGYDAFLMEVVRGIKDPMADQRAREIMSYLKRIGPLSDKKFSAGLEVVRKIGNAYLNVYAGYLFHTKDIADELRKKQYKRLDAYFALAQNGKLGLPVPVSFETAFFELVGGLGAYGSYADNQLILYCYDRYGRKVGEGKAQENHKIFKAMYRHEDEAEIADRILAHLCTNLNASDPDDRLASTMYEFARDLVKRANDKKATQDARAMYVRHFGEYKSACRDQLAATLGKTEWASTRRDVMFFCLEHGIDVPGLIPTVDSLTGQLSDDDFRRQREAADLLVAMGARAKPAEAKVLKLLRRADRMRGSGTTNMLWSLIGILGNIGTTESEAHRLLLLFLDSRQHAVPDTVQVALAKIGRPVVPLLKKELPTKEVYIQIRIVETFGLMGQSARSELPYLRKLLKNATTAHLKDALEDAIDDIDGGV